MPMKRTGLRPPLIARYVGQTLESSAHMTSLLAPLASVVSAIFAALSGLHVYWALGGHRGLKVAIPEMDGKAVFRPGIAGTLVVALLLAVAATLVLERAAIGPGIFPSTVNLWGAWGVATTLVGRAVGEFKYVGFFKRHRMTNFARWDTSLYSPLALVLGVGAGIVAWGGG